MARNEERRRVRERLGSLAAEAPDTRSVPGGRWDLDEFDDPVPGRRPDDDGDEWEETVEGPRTPQWLSEPSSGLAVWHERLVPERFRGTRLDPGRRGLLVLAAVGLVAVVLAAAAAQRERPVAQPVPPLPVVRAGTAGATSTSGAAPSAGVSGTSSAGGMPGGSAPSGVPPAGVSDAVRPGDVPGAATPAGAPGAATPAGVSSAATSAGVPGTVSAGGVSGSAPTAGGSGDRMADLVVSVVGMVEHPGLLHLPPGSRVADAVSATVAKDGADLAGLNLAQRLVDGDQVVVGTTAPDSVPPQTGSAVVPGRRAPTAASGGPSHPATKVDLNTATESDLDALPGVGPTTARAIIAWRTEHGRFTTIDQLAEVTGIGPARLARIRDLVKI